jgi:hypothetical protein
MQRYSLSLFKNFNFIVFHLLAKFYGYNFSRVNLHDIAPRKKFISLLLLSLIDMLMNL